MGRLAAVSLLLLCAGCASPGALKNFTTDGCSLFPDGALGEGEKSWLDCCVAHDLAYWAGGTREQREHADQGLKACIARRTGDAKLADTMYEGARLGGGPMLPTWYRWGYGWSYGRGYDPLSRAERGKVAALRKEYCRTSPQFCRK